MRRNRDNARPTKNSAGRPRPRPSTPVRTNTTDPGTESSNSLADFEAQLDKRLQQEQSDPNLTVKDRKRGLRNYMLAKSRVRLMEAQEREMAEAEPPSPDDEEVQEIAWQIARSRETGEGRLTMTDLLFAQSLRHKSTVFGTSLPDFDFDVQKENNTGNSFPRLPLANLKQFIDKCCDANGNIDASPEVQRVIKAHSARELDAIIDDLVTFIVKTAGQAVNMRTRIMREKVGIPQTPASLGWLLELLAWLLLQRQKVGLKFPAFYARQICLTDTNLLRKFRQRHIEPSQLSIRRPTAGRLLIRCVARGKTADQTTNYHLHVL